MIPSMSSRENKRKRKTTPTTKDKKNKQSPNPYFPDDMLLIIVAHVSRLYYPTLSLVSKSFRSFVTSPELYKIRSGLGHTECCIYVCLYFPRYWKTCTWFTLCRKPNKETLTNETINTKSSNSGGYVLATVPNSRSPRECCSSIVAVGSDIYNIGIYKTDEAIPILDCKTHTWRKAPSLRVDLMSVSASVLDQKIYVAGQEERDGSVSGKNFFEVFDTKTKLWEPKPIPSNTYNNRTNFGYCNTACIDGKFHVVTYAPDQVFAYESNEGRWDRVGKQSMDCIINQTILHPCVINHVVYVFWRGEFECYDIKERKWKSLKGLVGLHKFPSGFRVRLAGYGGKIAAFWDEVVPSSGGNGKKMVCQIWCAVIAVEKRKNCEIWGEFEWIGHVLTVPQTCIFDKVIAVTV